MSGLSHFQRLEAESLHIFREVVATSENPVMLWSIGKDSCVLLHLVMKAFHPAPRRFHCCMWTPPGSLRK
jgi:sulfate adenylyltransferase subunit 2